ncbi:MAG: DNA mismatch repair endonuclease MutL [Lachnospiraceae bacterium]|nr:DNA mismatch repair endonuclease MutL [Lachnospiraceae bacterium]
MGKIQVLDKLTIDKIAAGEVVERPLSVVKELVENAIDAGAKTITVEIKEGGISMIRISDNGSGIAGDDLKNAFLRHSTSKIKEADDLNYIASLGFRGEALSSISAVSMMEVITKTQDEMMGKKILVEGGVIGEITEVGAPDGTTMIVRNLFYNTPARKKFLKTPQTEAGYISSMMEHLSLSRPDIAMRFIVNGQTRLQTAGNGNLKDNIYRIFGRDVMNDLMPFTLEEDGIAIEGFMAKPALSRGNRSYENFFVNGRYIKSTMLSKACEEGYKSFIMQHKFPFVILNIKVDAAKVDVNVHPTKMEVRFSEEPKLYDMLVKHIRYMLSHQDLIAGAPMVEEKEAKQEHKKVLDQMVKPEPFEGNKLEQLRRYVKETSPYEPKFKREVQPIYQKPVIPKMPEVTKEVEIPPEPVVEKPVQQSLFQEDLHFLDKKTREKHRIIGQVFETYWLVEFNDSLYIIDQHAAHERILYEKTMKQLETKEMSSQQLCPPMVISLSDRELLLLNRYKEQFEAIGFGLEEFGGNDMIINQVPYNMFGLDNKELFLSMVDELEDFSGKETPSIVLAKVAMMSCKAAVKGNQHISRKEAESIIDELLEMENPYHCPHGRPTIIEMKKTEMERRFHR